MRTISKKESGGYHLDQANENPPENSTEAKSRWSRFGYKAKLLDNLLDEQYGLCCYSEIRADIENLGYHIEHVQPKSYYPAQTFDYSNLAASALSSDDLHTKILKAETFAGHAKLSQYDFTLFVSCHDPDCDRFFSYLSDGRVISSHHLSSVETDRANYTINLLNLNSPYLVNRRRRWYDELDQLYEDHINQYWSVEHLAMIDLLPINNRLSPFFSMTRQFFGKVAEQVLQQHQPELT